jgi:hypothetical protein
MKTIKPRWIFNRPRWISKNLPTRKDWTKSDYQDFYDRDVKFLLRSHAALKGIIKKLKKAQY